jgi:hypothetical protein
LRKRGLEACEIPLEVDYTMLLERREIATYRDVSIGVMARVAEALGWSRAKRAVLWFGIHAIYAIERLWRWRRMATIEPPLRPGALAPRALDRAATV